MSTPLKHFVDFGDGNAREIRYPVTVVRKLRERFGENMLDKPLYEFLPAALYEGLLVKNIELKTIEEMVDMPMLEDLMFVFLKAWTGKDLKALKEQAEKNAQSAAAASQTVQ